MPTNQSIDLKEIKKFEEMASEWWDSQGKFKPLHHMNPCRLDYIISQIEIEFNRSTIDKNAFNGINILDIGCGGGLLSEPMARLGANVTGIDAAAKNIPIAQIHAKQSGLDINYKLATAESLLAEQIQFDVILNMEVIEHVKNPKEYVNTCSKLLKPNGLMICSTINRTSKSFFLAILGAEYVLRWLPKGTHQWNKFIKPNELYDIISSAGLELVDKRGFVLNPIAWEWQTSDRDLSVNYVTTSTKPA
jgi:2-polyprenyl-6-hydroxyphenyl methylase/3-demethylubiquinone-9 3-methyltransferase